MALMLLLKSKWFLIILLTLIVLVGLYLAGRKSVYAEILIQAQPTEIWQVLINKEAYCEWNTVLVPVEGELIEGTKVNYEFYQDENSQSKILSKVKRVIEDSLLNQKGGIPGILTFNHKYILEPAKGGTNVIIQEDYKGIGVLFWDPSPVQEAYERLCKNLNDRVIQLKVK